MRQAGVWFFMCAAGMLFTSNTYAVNIGQSVKSSLERRLSSEVGSSALSSAERFAQQKILRDIDVRTLERLQARFGQHIMPEQAARATAVQSRILSPAEFDGYLQRIQPSMTPSERATVLGYYYRGDLYVDRQHIQVPLTLAHERLHQLSNARYPQVLGQRVNEGTTEVFAKRIYGDLGLRESPAVYLEEQRLIQALEARVGEESLASAFFRGDFRPMGRFLESDLGRGGFDRFSQACRDGRLGEALAILRVGGY